MFLDNFLDRLSGLHFSALNGRLSGVGVVLVFLGTLAQVDLGLYKAQNEFFRSFFIYWGPGGSWRIPVFPGGYLVGGVLLLNLVASQFGGYAFTATRLASGWCISG